MVKIIVAQIDNFTECVFVLLEVEVNGEQVSCFSKQSNFTLISYAWFLFLNLKQLANDNS